MPKLSDTTALIFKLNYPVVYHPLPHLSSTPHPNPLLTKKRETNKVSGRGLPKRNGHLTVSDKMSTNSRSIPHPRVRNKKSIKIKCICSLVSGLYSQTRIQMLLKSLPHKKYKNNAAEPKEIHRDKAAGDDRRKEYLGSHLKDGFPNISF